MQRLEIEVFDQDISDEDDSMGKASVSLVDLVEGRPKMVAAKLKAFDSAGRQTEDSLGEVCLSTDAKKVLLLAFASCEMPSQLVRLEVRTP